MQRSATPLPLVAGSQRRHAASAPVAAAFLGLLLLAPVSSMAAAMPFIVPDGAVPLWSDDFDKPLYTLDARKWTRVTGKPAWQLQVRERGAGALKSRWRLIWIKLRGSRYRSNMLLVYEFVSMSNLQLV